MGGLAAGLLFYGYISNLFAVVAGKATFNADLCRSAWIFLFISLSLGMFAAMNGKMSEGRVNTLLTITTPIAFCMTGIFGTVSAMGASGGFLNGCWGFSLLFAIPSCTIMVWKLMVHCFDPKKGNAINTNLFKVLGGLAVSFATVSATSSLWTSSSVHWPAISFAIGFGCFAAFSILAIFFQQKGRCCFGDGDHNAVSTWCAK